MIFASLRKWWQSRTNPRIEPSNQPVEVEALIPDTRLLDLDIPADDPFLAHLLQTQGVVELSSLKLESPALDKLRSEGVTIVVPLISQGELIGSLNLGPRRSEQEYSSDDHRLLASLATQAAPALRVAQLARQQQLEARERERIEQELRVARLIQETLLPKQLPELPGWKVRTHWQPAREVSGDFYDFISFPDGKLGLLIADVTDKGVPAALVMSTTRSILRATAELHQSPGKVLALSNESLCPTMPPNMFVTLTYALLDPASGLLRYANAGHPPMLLSCTDGVIELKARGMPLGLFPEMEYEEKDTKINPGDLLLLYSDGLVEAHNVQGSMFGFQQVRERLDHHSGKGELIENLLTDLSGFTGAGWEQEDDVTLVTLEKGGGPEDENEKILDEFTLPSQPGNEREAMRRVASVIGDLGFDSARIDRIKTAVAEGTMNAMEHGNKYREDQPATVKVILKKDELVVQIKDYGGQSEIPKVEDPDLDAKLAGLQSPRGWGLFLIRSMVDELRTHSDHVHHTIELVFKR